MQHVCEITVLDTKHFPGLQEQYLAIDLFREASASRFFNLFLILFSLFFYLPVVYSAHQMKKKHTIRGGHKDEEIQNLTLALQNRCDCDSR